MTELLGQLVANAAFKSGLYVLLAIGFGLLVRTLRVFNIGYGAVILSGAYGTIAAQQTLGAPFLIAGALGVVTACLCALLLEFVVFRPIDRRGVSANGAMIASLGVYVIAQNLILLTFGPGILVFSRDPFPTFHLGAATISSVQVYQLIAGVLLALALGWAHAHSSKLQQLRALGENPRLVAFTGGNVERARSTVWLLSAAIAGVAGAIAAIDFGISPRGGLDLFLVGAVAAYVGGISRLAGWILGAVAMAMIESLSALFIDARWALTVSFVAAIALLLLKPGGILTVPTRSDDIRSRTAT